MTTKQPPVVPAELAHAFKVLRQEQCPDRQGATTTFWNYDWETISAWRMTMNKDNRAALQDLLENLTIAMDEAEAALRDTPSPDALLMYAHIFGAAQALDDLLANILEKQGSAPWVNDTPENDTPEEKA